MSQEGLSEEQWAFECRMREREMALQERKLEHEMRSGNKREGWFNPLVVAVLAAAVAAGGNAYVTKIEGEQSRILEAQLAEQRRALETTRAEFARIQGMLETGDPDTAAENLRFLVEVGLVSDETMRDRLTNFLEKRTPGEGPALSSVFSGAQRTITRQELEFGSIPPRMIQAAIRASGICPSDDPRLHDGVFGGLTVDCWQRYVQRLPEETIVLVQLAPDLLKAWASEGLPDDWEAQISALRRQ
ncbi:MAG: hypothetical protein AB8B58_19680 [Roseobacter sp.]